MNSTRRVQADDTVEVSRLKDDALREPALRCLGKVTWFLPPMSQYSSFLQPFHAVGDEFEHTLMVQQCSDEITHGVLKASSNSSLAVMEATAYTRKYIHECRAMSVTYRPNRVMMHHAAAQSRHSVSVAILRTHARTSGKNLRQ